MRFKTKMPGSNSDSKKSSKSAGSSVTSSSEESDVAVSSEDEPLANKFKAKSDPEPTVAIKSPHSSESESSDHDSVLKLEKSETSDKSDVDKVSNDGRKLDASDKNGESDSDNSVYESVKSDLSTNFSPLPNEEVKVAPKSVIKPGKLKLNHKKNRSDSNSPKSVKSNKPEEVTEDVDDAYHNLTLTSSEDQVLKMDQRIEENKESVTTPIKDKEDPRHIAEETTESEETSPEILKRKKTVVTSAADSSTKVDPKRKRYRKTEKDSLEDSLSIPKESLKIRRRQAPSRLDSSVRSPEKKSLRRNGRNTVSYQEKEEQGVNSDDESDPVPSKRPKEMITTPRKESSTIKCVSEDEGSKDNPKPQTTSNKKTQIMKKQVKSDFDLALEMHRENSRLPDRSARPKTFEQESDTNSKPSKRKVEDEVPVCDSGSNGVAIGGLPSSDSGDLEPSKTTTDGEGKKTLTDLEYQQKFDLKKVFVLLNQIDPSEEILYLKSQTRKTELVKQTQRKATGRTQRKTKEVNSEQEMELEKKVSETPKKRKRIQPRTGSKRKPSPARRTRIPLVRSTSPKKAKRVKHANFPKEVNSRNHDNILTESLLKKYNIKQACVWMMRQEADLANTSEFVPSIAKKQVPLDADAECSESEDNGDETADKKKLPSRTDKKRRRAVKTSSLPDKERRETRNLESKNISPSRRSAPRKTARKNYNENYSDPEIDPSGKEKRKSSRNKRNQSDSENEDSDGSTKVVRTVASRKYYEDNSSPPLKDGIDSGENSFKSVQSTLTKPKSLENSKRRPSLEDTLRESVDLNDDGEETIDKEATLPSNSKVSLINEEKETASDAERSELDPVTKQSKRLPKKATKIKHGKVRAIEKPLLKRGKTKEPVAKSTEEDENDLEDTISNESNVSLGANTCTNNSSVSVESDHENGASVLLPSQTLTLPHEHKNPILVAGENNNSEISYSNSAPLIPLNPENESKKSELTPTKRSKAARGRKTIKKSNSKLVDSDNCDSASSSLQPATSDEQTTIEKSDPTLKPTSRLAARQQNENKFDSKNIDSDNSDIESPPLRLTTTEDEGVQNDSDEEPTPKRKSKLRNGRKASKTVAKEIDKIDTHSLPSRLKAKEQPPNSDLKNKFTKDSDREIEDQDWSTLPISKVDSPVSKLTLIRKVFKMESPLVHTANSKNNDSETGDLEPTGTRKSRSPRGKTPVRKSLLPSLEKIPTDNDGELPAKKKYKVPKKSSKIVANCDDTLGAKESIEHKKPATEEEAENKIFSDSDDDGGNEKLLEDVKKSRKDFWEKIDSSSVNATSQSQKTPVQFVKNSSDSE